MDAIIALSIFLASLVFFSRFFTDANFTGLSGIGIYSKSESFLLSYESENQTFFDIYSNYINDISATPILDEMLTISPYPTNLRFYLLDGNNLKLIANSSSHQFSQALILRRFVVYSDISEEHGFTNATISVQSGAPNTTIQANITITNPGPNNWTNIAVTDIYVEGYEHWNITPALPQNLPDLEQGESATAGFNIEIPAGTTASTYYFNAEIDYNDGSPQDEYPYQTFYIVNYGLVEMEVGLE
jgi:hypothetical protein